MARHRPTTDALAPTTGFSGVTTVALSDLEAVDAAAGTSTDYLIQTGDRFGGTISSVSDSDWIAIDLVAGQSYSFLLYGTGGAPDGMEDTVLQLMNGAGTQVAINDNLFDDVNNTFSGLNFTAATTGRFYLNVSGTNGSTGTYALQAATSTYTVDQVVTMLTDVFWGAPTALAHAETDGDITVNLAGLSAAGITLARGALDIWTMVTGLTFTETTATDAELLIDNTFAGSFGGPALFYPQTGEIVQGSVNVGNDWIAHYGTGFNTYTFSTFVHEIGHALGLGHPGSYDGSAVYAQDAFFANDSWQMSIMSYFSTAQNTAVEGSDWFPITPMIADVAAMWKLYGTPVSVQGGNTVWGANSNVGGTMGTIFDYAFDGQPLSELWQNTSLTLGIGFTIVDTGGTDLFDVSTYSAGGQVLDLRSGGVSSVLGEVGNVVMAVGTVIENARTGIGADSVTGNAAANTVTLGAGNDSVFGLDGNDTLLGEDGNDRLDGGNGNDNIDGGKNNDRLFGVEGDDSLIGGSGNDTMSGGNGRDTVDGGKGDDSMLGDAGDDRMFGGKGNDTLVGGDGLDTLKGDAGNDLLTGGALRDTFQFDVAKVPRGGIDTVTDYQNGTDRIWFIGIAGDTADARYAALTITETAGDTVIRYGDTSVVLDNVLSSLIDMSDFVFT